MNPTQPARAAVTVKRISLVLALGLAVPAMAQDGQRRTGVPVTNPETDKEIHRTIPPVSPAPTSADFLPPVPASINDPAPFGTRAVAVPSAVEPQPSRAELAGVRHVEGVIVSVEPTKDQDKGENAIGQESVRLRLDPNQTWLDYSTQGAKLKPAASKPDSGDEPKPDEPAQAGGPTSPILTLVVTKNSRIFVHARTREGQDLYGVPTISSPNNQVSGRGVNGRVPAQQPSKMETNFTNIRDGSFVSVRYRMVGNLAEVVNLNLIEYPVVAPGEAASVPGRVPNTVPGRGVPSSAGTPVGAPVRVPVVPGRTASPGTLPK